MACHVFWVSLIVFLTRRGIHIPERWASLGELALIGAGTGLWAAGVHWLQTRPGSSWWARGLRAVGRVLVLGNVTLPAYPPPPTIRG